jgi:dTDP-4-dehydrorhamnose 3,5-epimerase
MKFIDTKVSGTYIIDIERQHDDRGFFARTYCRTEFMEHGLDADFVQCNVSFNLVAGTLRGMHFQLPPHDETKLVRCTAGALYDVVIDLRPDSPTFEQWEGVELTAESHRMVYVPSGCAHGFLTLAMNTEVSYLMGNYYKAQAAQGVRWDDPTFDVSWPRQPAVISHRDASYTDFRGSELEHTLVGRQ